MPPRTRLTKEETRQCILTKADEWFRRYGFGKTTIADLAGELGMSPANIYKFFPSKNAIIQACAERNIRTLKSTILADIRTGGSACSRLEKMTITVFQFHRELLRNERQIFNLIQTAREEAWSCIEDYDTFLLGILHQLVEEGVHTGEFRADLPPDTVVLLRDCLMSAFHPHLRRDFHPDEDDTRASNQVRFLCRALK